MKLGERTASCEAFPDSADCSQVTTGLEHNALLDIYSEPVRECIPVCVPTPRAVAVAAPDARAPGYFVCVA